jgi:GNAT superfamily N-acetyltransferase
VACCRGLGRELTEIESLPSARDRPACVVQGANAGFLAGGYTRPDVRGRGVYGALVRARWDAVVAAGTPALTVSAGRMSRPILEGLGFQTVGWIDCLLDDFA